MPSELSTFQREFASSIVSGTRSAFDRSPGFDVYRNTSAVAAIEALSAAYPATRAILGDREFRRLARAYFRSDPPETPVLAYYGGNFPDWLEWRPEPSHPSYLTDIARIDRMQLEAHLAADPEEDATFAAPQIAGEEWTRVEAQLHPATRFLWFDRPTPSIWLALRASIRPEEIAPEWNAEGILLTRPGGAVDARLLDRLQFELLTAFASGDVVGDAAIEAAHRHPDCDMGAAFRHLLQSGAIHGFKRKEQLR
jgi:hypothetical protein